MATSTTFWRLVLDGTPAGLFRRVEEDGDAVSFAFLDQTGWVDDPALARWWIDPGDRELIEVDRSEARPITARVAVGLDATAK